MRNGLCSLTLISAWILLASRAPNAFAVAEVPGSFSLDGTLYSASGSAPLLDAHAKVRVQIFTAPACVLYEEEQEVNTSVSDGAFSIQVGAALSSPLRVGADSNNTLTQVFQNKLPISGNGATCVQSAGAGAARKMRVIITPSGESPQTLSPDMVISSLPNALVADTLQGTPASGFAQLGFESLSQANLEQVFSNANFSTLLTLLTGGGASNGGSSGGAYNINSGTSSTGGINLQVAGITRASITSNGSFNVGSAALYVNAANDRVGLGTTAPAVSLDMGAKSDALLLPRGNDGQRPTPAAAGMLRFSTASNKVEFYDGLGWSSLGTDIAGINAGGDLSGTYPNPSVGAIRGQSVSAIASAAGQVLRYDGSNYTPRYVALSDLKNTAGGNAFSAACSANQTLTWSSVDDTFTCVTITGLSGTAIGSGTIDAARLPAVALAWASVTGGINYAGGNVGIGTANPAGILHAVGNSGGDVAAILKNTNGGGRSLLDLRNSNDDFAQLLVHGPSYSVPQYRGAAMMSAKNDFYFLTDASNASGGTKKISFTTGGYNNAPTLTVSGGNPGKVGIGTSDPALTLQVNGSAVFGNGGSGSQAYIRGTTNAYSTAIVPDYSWYYNDLTGIFHPGADTIGFTTGGTEKLRITQNGNIGIGSTNPNDKLDVNGSITTTGATIKGKAEVKQVVETAVNLGATVAGSVTLDLSAGTYFYGTVTGATTLAVSNVAAAGLVSSFTLELVNAGATTITWMAGTRWPYGTAPTLTAAGTDLLVCSTRDAGSNWRCVAAEPDSR